MTTNLVLEGVTCALRRGELIGMSQGQETKSSPDMGRSMCKRTEVNENNACS